MVRVSQAATVIATHGEYQRHEQGGHILLPVSLHHTMSARQNGDHFDRENRLQGLARNRILHGGCLLGCGVDVYTDNVPVRGLSNPLRSGET